MHPDLRRDLLRLLRNPALARVLDALHASIAKYEAPRGRVEIRTREEAVAVEDLIGRWFRPGSKASVAEIDQRLRENTIFHCSLADAIGLYRGAPIVRPREEKARFVRAREQAIERCFALLPELRLSPEAYARVVGWMSTARKDLRAGFRKWGADGLAAAVRAVALTFDRMPREREKTVFLADLAAAAAGDAHGLDNGRPASTLLFRALEFHYPETAARERRGSAAWRANLLSEAGIARDPISVRVDTFGLEGDTPYLRELRRAELNRPLNLDDLAQIAGDVRAWRDVAFVVENPTVFAGLIKHVRALYRVESHPTLICTNGTLNRADWALLDALHARGTQLFYSGDFDARGLGIAESVLARYPTASTWRMSAADYANAVRDSRTELDPRGLDRLRRSFPELVDAMTRRGQSADHEPLAEWFTADLDRFVSRGITPPVRNGGTGGAGIEVPSS